MNWMTVLWPMGTGACLALALINLRIALGDCQRAPHLFFSCAALAVAVISVLELALMQTTDIAGYETLLRWAVVPLWIMIASVAGFVWSFFGMGRKWLALIAVGLHAVADIANLTTSVPVFRHAVAIRQVETFGGARFTVPTLGNGPWNFIELASVLMLVAFILDASIALWRSGGRRRAAIVGGSIIFFLFASRGHAILVEKGVVETPFLVSFCFLGVLIAMGHELSYDVLRAAKLAHELRESEERMSLAADSANLGMWEWNLSTDEIWATKTRRALLGWPASGKLTPENFISRLHPDDRDPIRQMLKEAAENGRGYDSEYRVVLPDGSVRWMAARGTVQLNGHGKPVRILGISIDITTRKQAEFQIQQTREEMGHLSRVALLGEMVASLAHELNQPLTGIVSNASAGKRFLDRGDVDLRELRELLCDISADGQRAGDVIRGIRGMVKKGGATRQPMDLNELVMNVVRLVNPDALLRACELKTSLAPNLPTIEGDPIQFQQVLLNLVVNAFEAMRDTPVSKRKVVIATEWNGNGSIRTSVRDFGMGIPEEARERLFDQFFTTKAEGLGMGLAIVRSIVESNAGTIAAENVEGGGARFHFTIPAETGASE